MCQAEKVIKETCRRFHRTLPNLGLILGLRTGSVPGIRRHKNTLNPSLIRTGYSS